MSRTVFCVKMQKELPGLLYPPFVGPLGERIFREVSQEAWRGWLGQSTMIINEYRLNPAEPQAKEILHRELHKHLFGDGSKPPDGFVAPPSDPSP